jgi:hypothetical protein
MEGKIVKLKVAAPFFEELWMDEKLTKYVRGAG